MPLQHPVGFASAFVMEAGINRLRFAEAQKLLDLGAAVVDETGRERLRGGRMMLAAQATRGTHTFESVIALCMIGRGVQASMLNRALLEDALDVHWVAEHPDEAPVLADKHDRFMALAERRVEAEHERADPLTKDNESELERLKREFGGFFGSWTRASPAARRNLVIKRWGEAQAKTLDYVYDGIQRQNNLLLHSSPTALGLTMSHDPVRGPQINRLGPDLRWRDALSHGVLGYYVVCRVVAEEFGFDKDPIAETFNRASCFLKPVEEVAPGGIEPDDDCPCGSGLTVGACHGS